MRNFHGTEINTVHCIGELLRMTGFLKLIGQKQRQSFVAVDDYQVS